METRSAKERRLAATLIQEIFRTNRRTIPISTMTAFFLNPYSQVLNLSYKSHLKLYSDGCKGLDKELKFDGKRENFNDFVKLISQKMSSRKVRECFNIATEWETTGTVPEQPETFKDIFANSESATDEMKEHCNRIWSTEDITHVNSSKLTKKVATKPTNKAELDVIRNELKLKHAMLGAMIWDSLTAKYQLELVGDEDEYKVGDEFDGVKLWSHISKSVNPSTTIGAATFKDSIESKKLSDFEGHNVKKYSIWFKDMRAKIISLEGKHYNEYVRCLFKALLTSTNQEFLDTMKAEKRLWIQGKQKADYSYKDVLDAAETSYNNIDAENLWNAPKTTVPTENKNDEIKGNSEIVALTAKLEQLVNRGSSDNSSYPKRDHSWRYQNLEGKAIGDKMTRNDKTYYVCDKDCHPKKQWCIRKDCMNKADYKKKKDDERASKGNGAPAHISNDFKVALAAVCNEADYAALESQFFGKAGM